MCCIFTCCGWMIDLVQRLWTFTMSCCITSAVCCSFVTAAMSGIALGYNYSLAEYIDLKETNVSVYIKRGVFDDEVGDDTDWRRSGHLPIAGHIGEKNLITAPPEEDDSLALRSGRRLDDSVFESNDQNRFEGSLMKLTARAPYRTSATTGVTSDLEMADIISKYPQGSIDQLKAIQSLINMRKSGDSRGPTTTEKPKSSTYGYDERYLPHFPAYPDPMEGGRRRMPDSSLYATPPPPNAARQAVPDVSINEPAKWRLPKLPPGDANRVIYGDYAGRFTYPPPVTPRPGPVRPPKATIGVFRGRPTQTTLKVVKTTPKTIDIDIPKSIDRGLEEFKEKLALGKYEPEMRDEDFLKMPKSGSMKYEEDYEEDIKGLPVRRRRQVDPINTQKTEINISIQAKDELIANYKVTTIRNIKLKANDIETSTLIHKILAISSKLNTVSADTSVSEMKSINKASKGEVYTIKSNSELTTDQQRNSKANDVDISSKLPEKPADISVSALETINLASKQAIHEYSNTKTNADQKINVKANNIDTNTFSNKILITSNKLPEKPADTSVSNLETMETTNLKTDDHFKSKSEMSTDQNTYQKANDIETSSLFNKMLVISNKFAKISPDTAIPDSESMNFASKQTVNEVNYNFETTKDQQTNVEAKNIQKSTFTDKILVISSKLPEISEDRSTLESKTLRVALKQATDKVQSAVANDIILGKLLSPKGITLNLLQSTVA